MESASPQIDAPPPTQQPAVNAELSELMQAIGITAHEYALDMGGFLDQLFRMDLTSVPAKDLVSPILTTSLIGPLQGGILNPFCHDGKLFSVAASLLVRSVDDDADVIVADCDVVVATEFMCALTDAAMKWAAWNPAYNPGIALQSPEETRALLDVYTVMTFVIQHVASTCHADLHLYSDQHCMDDDTELENLRPHRANEALRWVINSFRAAMQRPKCCLEVIRAVFLDRPLPFLWNVTQVTVAMSNAIKDCIESRDVATFIQTRKVMHALRDAWDDIGVYQPVEHALPGDFLPHLDAVAGALIGAPNLMVNVMVGEACVDDAWTVLDVFLSSPAFPVDTVHMFIMRFSDLLKYHRNDLCIVCVWRAVLKGDTFIEVEGGESDTPEGRQAFLESRVMRVETVARFLPLCMGSSPGMDMRFDVPLRECITASEDSVEALLVLMRGGVPTDVTAVWGETGPAVPFRDWVTSSFADRMWFKDFMEVLDTTEMDRHPAYEDRLTTVKRRRVAVLPQNGL